jgi:hypothetical protein
MRRAQTLLRPKAFRPLTRGVSSSLQEGNRAFARIRQAPEFEWGVTLVFDDPIYNIGQGQFLDRRAVIVGGTKIVNDNPLVPTDEAWVFSADGTSKTALPDFPDNGGFTILSTTLGDGRILFCGGVTGAKTRTLDPVTLTWTSQPDMAGDAVSGYTLVTLANGNALRIGGFDSLSAPTASVEEFVQGSNNWSARAPMGNARAGCIAVLLADGRVLVTAGGVATAEIFDPGTNTWTPTANNPQAGNRAFMLVTTAEGQTFAADSNNAFTLYIDRFDLATDSFIPLSTMSGSFQTVSSGPGAQLLFDIGGGFLAMVLKSFHPREAFYDIKTDSWFEKSIFYPEPLPTTDALFHLSKNTFLGVGGSLNTFILPHHVGRYAILSTLRKDDGVKPTFTGLNTVEGGRTLDRVFLKWDPASDAKTFVDDINYYVYLANTSGGQDFGPSGHYATTQAWAGSKGIELKGLTPDTDYYFVVRARDMCVYETIQGEEPSQFNLDTNTVEIFFHTPASPPAPTWNWTAAPSMSQTRRNLNGMKIGWGPVSPNGDVSRFLVFGGTTDDPGPPPVTGDIYSLDGQDIEPVTVPPQFDWEGAAVVHADVNISFDGENRYGIALGGIAGGFFRLQMAPRYNPYHREFGGSLDIVSQLHSLTPDMQEAVSYAAAAGLEANGVLRTGGETDLGPTNTVERLLYLNCQTVFFTAESSPFTIGATVTGGTSGASGTIEEIQSFGGGSGRLTISSVTGGFFVFGEQLTDSLGGDAFASSFSSGPFYLQKWVFAASMLNKRMQHSAIEMDDGRILVAGGYNENSEIVRDVEIYNPGFDAWVILPGYEVSYDTSSGAVSFLNGTWIATDTFKYGFLKIDLYVAPSNSGVLGFSTTGDASGLVGIGAGEVISDTNFQISSVVGGSFNPGDTVTGSISGATAVVWAVPPTVFPSLVVGAVVGGFIPGETIDNGIGVTATLDNISGSGKTALTTSGLVEKVREHVQFPLVKLDSGDVLLIGGDQNIGGDSFVDQVNAAGNTVTFRANLPGSRQRHTAHKFADGQVGVFGGAVNGTPSADCRLYDPSANTWSHPAGIDMGTPRAGHVSFMLPNNTVLVVGGEDDLFQALSSAEISGP